MKHLTNEELRTRYPNVFTLLTNAYVLTEGEALDAIRGHLTEFGGGSEAVMCAGGGTEMLENATRDRQRELTRLEHGLRTLDN